MAEANDSDWKSVKLGSFAAMGLPEEANAWFCKKVAIPAGWNGQRVQLVFDSQHPYGIYSKGKLWVNGQESLIQPNGLENFTLDLTKQAATGNLTLALEIKSTNPDPKKVSEVPSGVTGIFYLQALPLPAMVMPLTGPWFAADENNVLAPVQPAKPGKYTYLETRFTLPKAWPARRLYLESPGAHLGWIILNDQVLETPRFMRVLDVSGLVNKAGENVLRWLPATSSAPNYQHTENKPIPALELTWLP